MTTANSSTTMTIEGDRAITITRTFDAPPELVFQAHVDPQLLARWYGPQSLSTIVDALDARAGGAWRFVIRDGEGNEYGSHGIFHAVAPGERIVRTFEFEGAPGQVALETVIFERQGNRTKLIRASVFQTPEDRDAMLQSGMDQGVSEFDDRLEELLRTLR